MKQTAVEWLVDQLEKKGDASVNMSIGRMQISIIEEDYINLLKQAKEMEKQQIIDACNQEECFGSYGYGIHEDITKGEEYYNVTFNK